MNRETSVEVDKNTIGLIGPWRRLLFPLRKFPNRKTSQLPRALLELDAYTESAI